MIEDTYRDGTMLRRWFVLDGQARCPLDAVPVDRLSRADRAAILAANQTVRDRLALVDAYEAALRLSVQDEPPETIAVTDEDGIVSDEPNPAHAAWVEAGETVDNASADTLALYTKRLGYTVETVDGEDVQVPVEPDPLPEDTITLLDPMPSTVLRYQALAALSAAGHLAAAEAVVAQAGGMTQIAWNETPSFSRSSPSLNAVAQALGLTDQQVDDLFRAAGKVSA